MNKTPYEYQEAITFAEWLDYRRIPYIHVPNERRMKARSGRLLNLQGRKKGFPDFLIFKRYSLRPGVAIELKRQKGGHVTLEQRGWLERLEKLGWIVAVCKGAGEAIQLIERLEAEEGGY